jgi:RNA-splicing ligase RtcB
MIVPFNMRDGVAICEGKSNSEWLNSCAHGAGRKMSRSKAKENVTMEEFKESMKNVYSTTVCEGTIDESPMAYKDTNEIAELIKETCVIKKMLAPRINIKATC